MKTKETTQEAQQKTLAQPGEKNSSELSAIYECALRQIEIELSTMPPVQAIGITLALAVAREAMCHIVNQRRKIVTEPTQSTSAVSEPDSKALASSGSSAMETEWLVIDITRTQGTGVYIKVPKGWRPKGRDRWILARAAEATCKDHDWDDYGWEETVEMQSCKPCTEEEAKQFLNYDATQDIASLEKQVNRKDKP